MPDDSPLKLLPPDATSIQLLKDMHGYEHSAGLVPEREVKKLLTPEALTHYIEFPAIDKDGSAQLDASGKPVLKRTHFYAWLLENENHRFADIVKSTMEKDPHARRFLNDVYTTGDMAGKMPLFHLAKGGQWGQVENLMRLGMPLENLDGKDTSILHLFSNAPFPPPANLLALLGEKMDALPEKQRNALLEQYGPRGLTPYHQPRNNATLAWMMARDQGRGLRLPMWEVNATYYKTAENMILEARNPQHQHTIDLIRGSVSDKEAAAMAMTMLANYRDLNMISRNSMAEMTQSLLREQPGDKNFEGREALLRQIHAKTYEWEHQSSAPEDQIPPKGAFESDYLKKAAGDKSFDKVLFRRVLEQAVKDGVDVNGIFNGVTYDRDGDVDGNMLYTAIRWQRENFSFLLNLKDGPDLKLGKDFKMNPDAALFAVPHIANYKEQMQITEALKDAGAKATRAKNGHTPMTDAITLGDLPLVSYMLRNDLALVPGNSKAKMLQEWRSHLKELDGRRSTNDKDRENYNQIGQMFDSYEQGRMIPLHIPPEFLPKPSGPFALLVKPEEFPTLVSAEAHSPSARTAQALSKMRKTSVAG